MYGHGVEGKKVRGKFLSVDNVTFRYFEKSNRNILENVSLEVESGNIVVILGSSGCGKSTLASVCTGLYPENGGKLLSGEIKVNGMDIGSISIKERVQLLTMMFQNPDLQFCMDTLRKEMIFCLENIGVSKNNMDKYIKEFSTYMGIENLLDQKLHSLSGGEKQKAVLCCILMINSKGIFLDEPFANIDEDSARDIILMLKKHNKSNNTTIIAIDHKIDFWLPIADEIIILGEKGRVISRGINKNNLKDYKYLFEKEGLFYPRELNNCKKRESVKNEAILLIDNLSIKRGKTKELILEKANASFERGRVTAILGPSGSGKTTLFSSILKQKKWEGNIILNNKSIKKIKEREIFKFIGTVFQNPGNQFIANEVKGEIIESLKIWSPKLSENEQHEESLKLLDDYGLSKYIKYSPYMLSQGQQRRLAVLSILTGNQKILLLDEPTYGQDKKSTDAIMKQLMELVKEKGLTIIFTTHDKGLAYEYADKIYILEGRELIEWRG